MELHKGDEAAARELDEYSENPDIEPDLPPEYCHYKDEGCDLAESCLNCPFAECIYDKPGGKQRWLKRLRAGEMVNLFTGEGKGVKELAQIFGVSQRTVQRTLKAALGNSKRKGQENG
jgi:DNA-binding transcriptional ArsR family regulator